MRFRAFCIVWLFLAAEQGYARSAENESVTILVNSLNVKPSSCITTREGRECFTDVVFKWQLKKVQDVCLINKNTGKTIRCWQQAQSGRIKVEFRSDKNVIFQLVGDNNQIINETSVDISWVYKSSPRKRRWRIF